MGGIITHKIGIVPITNQENRLGQGISLGDPDLSPWFCETKD